MARRPDILSDRDNWGAVLNDYLDVSLNEDGTIKDTAAAALPISDAAQAALGRIAPSASGGAVLEMVRPASTGVTLERVDSTTYWLQANMSDHRAVRWKLREFAPSGIGTTIMALDDVEGLYRVVSPWDDTTVGDDDESITYTGTWTTPSSPEMPPTLHRSNTPGDYAEWESPETTRLGIYVTRSSANGFAKIVIDNDATAATALPTAGELVAAGMMDAGALTANGGTLDPDDRILDAYGSPATYGVPVVLAEDLADATHTVRAIVTGEKNVASGSPTTFRLDVDGFFSSQPGSQLVETSERLNGLGSVSEYAFNLDAGGTLQYIGNNHGYDQQTDITFAVDGEPVTLADSETASGTELVVTRTSELSHPGVAGGAQGGAGTVVLEYRVSRGALTVTWVWTPAVTSTSTRNTMLYPMSAVRESPGHAFARGRVTSMASDLTLGLHDGTQHYPPALADTFVAWQPDGRWAHVVHVPDPARTFGDHEISLYVQDRESVIPDLWMAKVYWDHKSVPIVAGTPLRSQAVYVFADLGSPELMLASE